MLPSVAVFFMLLIAFYALPSNAMELARLGAAAYWWAMHRWAAVTPQQVKELEVLGGGERGEWVGDIQCVAYVWSLFLC